MTLTSPLTPLLKARGLAGTQTLKMMKLLFLLLTAGALHVSATGYSQTISYSAKNESLEKIFSVIGKQSGYKFFYDFNLIKDEKPVTVDFANASIDQAMKSCLQFSSLDYSIQDKTIVIVKKAKELISSIQTVSTIDIKGRIVNE